MSQNTDAVLLKPEQDTFEEQSLTSQAQSLWISSISFPETPQLPSQRFQESPILTSSTAAISQDSQHSISAPAIFSMVPPALHRTLTRCLFASSKPLPVLLEWRHGEAPFPTIKTRHVISNLDAVDSKTPSNGVPDVTFSEPMGWAKTIFDNHKKLVKIQRETAAAQPTGRAARSRSLQGRDRRDCFCRGNVDGSRSASHTTVKGGVAPTTRGPQAPHRNSKPQCTQKLLRALERHAEEHYNETGDTSELRRVMELHRRGGVRSVSV
ncbi:hypothetical protein QBC42DRAFT_288012 [Cladorrhinum samala]|uniref:Uncharacterized protein n=1 Tax=Cladorrhinum samala TaxID=585594 RepID=A0AAV9HJM0_9PEZI|nr:hypothetical protein QBC42DRAFT_288012 [Cladorrhinum samala]